jgi:hypothetical protein
MRPTPPRECTCAGDRRFGEHFEGCPARYEYESPAPDIVVELTPADIRDHLYGQWTIRQCSSLVPAGTVSPYEIDGTGGKP